MRTSSHERLKIAWVWAASVALVSCGLTAPPGPTKRPERQAPARTSIGQLGRGPMARVPSGTFGPHLVMTEVGPFVAWAEAKDDGAVWHTRVPGTERRLRLGPDLPQSSGTLAFFKLDRAKGGALLARVSRRDRVDTISVTVLTPSGATPPHEVSAGEGEVLWLASVVEPTGTRLSWARRRGAVAEVGMTLLDALGAPGPVEVLRGESIGWQLARGGAGTWLATLDGSSRKATLTLTRLDAEGQKRGPIEIEKGLASADQVDLAVGDSRVVVTAREGTSEGGRLLMAEVDASGAVIGAPKPITGPRGSQSLFELLPGAGSEGPWLAWEEAALDGPAWRRVLLARLRPDGVPAPDAWLDVRDGSSLLPSLASAERALVALSREAPCSGSGCEGTASGLSLLALASRGSADLAIARLPGLPEELDSGALCWDLDCLGSACALLCAENDSPTSVHFAIADPEAGLRAVPPGVAAVREPLRSLFGAPRMATREVVATVPELSDVALAGGGAGSLLAWVSYFDPALRPAPSNRPAPDGRREPFQAELGLLSIDRGGAGVAQPAPSQSISHRARSLGGVALSSPLEGQRVLGWAALDQGHAHVFVTLLDERGKKLKQRLLSRKSGEVTDVQVVATTAGFLVIWVDDRSGRGQVYAQAIDRQLNSVGPERALTTEATAPVGLSVLARRGELVVAFADDAAGRSGSIFALSVNLASLEPSVPARIVSRGEGHAHSPALIVGPAGNLGLLFVENRHRGDAETTSTLFGLTIDEGLRAVGAPAELMPGVNVSSFGVDCRPSSCRLVAIASGNRRAELWAAAALGTRPWRAEFLQALGGDAQRLPAPVVSESEAYVVTTAGQGEDFALERLTIDFAGGADVR